jgi:hypothetical protein
MSIYRSPRCIRKTLASCPWTPGQRLKEENFANGTALDKAAALKGASTCVLVTVAALQSVGVLKVRPGAACLLQRHNLKKCQKCIPAFAPFLGKETFEEVQKKVKKFQDAVEDMPEDPGLNESGMTWAAPRKLRPICAVFFHLLFNRVLGWLFPHV